ncbi:DUF6734 family protein [Granulicella arctica]|uniref:DUF6734 family protein n=1 Tax=Granulicella arctica TaxID=940613 RepID=UPI0021E02599|nr:DUF6734 family protein [Granulicella arctica]
MWSFWTKPFLAERHSSWASELHHWLAWGLSLAAASNHYPETVLVTDDAGARLLVDTLELPFAHVSTGLNSLGNEDPGWWSLGKMEAYRLQQEPFVHIDTDAFLWKPLRPDLEAADVFAQNPEPVVYGRSCYHPEDFESALGRPDSGWMPAEWDWYRQASLGHGRAECCGLFGGNRLDFIHHYVSQAMRLLRHRHNVRAWRNFADKDGNMILLEQYLLTACLEYHRSCADSSFHGIDIRYVFPSIDEAYTAESASEAGFTHLAAGAKRDAEVARDLQDATERELPEYFARCVDMVRTPEAVAC